MTIRTRGTLPVCAATVVVTLAGASLSIQHSFGAQAVAVDRGSRDYTLPDQMQWRATEDGTTSSLYGDPSKPGLYAYIVKRGPNVWSKPHFHDNDRFVTVLEGTFWVGTGTFDPFGIDMTAPITCHRARSMSRQPCSASLPDQPIPRDSELP